MQDSVKLRYVRGELSAGEYWAEEFLLYDFKEQCNGNSYVINRLRSAVDAGFWRLDRLSRSDAFWNNTNGLATSYKLAEFAEFEMRGSQNAVDAAWLAIALELHAMADQLSTRPWQVLLDSGVFEADFFVCTVYNSSTCWADQNIPRLAELAEELNVGPLIMDALKRLAAKGDAEEKWVSEAVRGGCSFG